MEPDDERDRRSGLDRVLAAIEAVNASLDETNAQLRRLHGRVAALENGTGGTGSVDAGAVRAVVDATVASLDIPSTVSDVQALITTALSVLPPPRIDAHHVADAIHDAIGTMAAPQVDPAPVVEAVRAAVEHELTAAAAREREARREEGAAIDPSLIDANGRLDAAVLRDVVRRAVAASHRALVTRLAELLETTGATAKLDDVALDVAAIRRAIERAGGATRDR